MILNWGSALSTEQTNAFCKELALQQLTAAKPCASRDAIERWVVTGAYAELCCYELDYGDPGMDPVTASSLRQVLALYQKRADIDIGIDKESVAVKKFVESERLCRATNDRFTDLALGIDSFDPSVHAVLHGAARKIAKVLGSVPTMSQLKLHFGPGATTQVKKQDASARSKLSSSFTCSEDLLSMLPSVLCEMPQWVDEVADWAWVKPEDPHDVDAAIGRWYRGENFDPVLGYTEHAALLDIQVVPGKLAFVPKNAKTHRSIVVEPMLNGMLQLGIGDVMRKRLLQFGVDLSDQSRNQRLALEGSLTGALATLDLSSASDTVSYELVRHLLPFDWFTLLDHARTGHVEYGKWVLRLEKFSSMGNGFTFPLESLIFWALAKTATEYCCDAEACEKVSVYGDDIIVPRDACLLLSKVLEQTGFLLNQSKSFIDGPFRESCGKDYLSGIDIRPVYLRDTLDGEAAFVLHNYFVRSLQPEAANVVLKWIAPQVVLWGPDGYGDGHLIGGEPPRPFGRDKGWAGYIFDTYTWKGRKCFKRLPGDCVLPCYTIYANPPSPIQREPEFRHVDANVRFWWGEALGFRNVNWRYKTEMSTYADQPSTVSYRKGRPGFGVTTPGTAGYKRISIYTLQVS